MAELILSELTRMGPGFCIIGLEAHGAGYRSVRPMPVRGHAWNPAWPHRRGDRLKFELAPSPGAAPHIEDRQSSGWVHRVDHFSEAELVRCLRSAETASHIPELFGCPAKINPWGAGAGWVSPEQAMRSICGCEVRSLRFNWKLDRWRLELRLPSNDVLRGLPIVDHEWNSFLEAAAEAVGPANQGQRLQRFLNGNVVPRLSRHELCFARMGLARPNSQGQCWIMLDSLFPQPRREWLDVLRPAGAGTEDTRVAPQ